MKKLRFFLTSIFLLCCSAIYAYDFEVDGIYYDISGTNASVTCRYYNSDYNSRAYSGDIVIPESVEYNGNTYSVTGIGERAFEYCRDLTSVVIPNSVTSIGILAFDQCSSLTSVVIPNSVTSIGNQAFLYCGGLTSVEIPNSVTSIGYRAFQNCLGLTSVEIPNSVTSIRVGTFAGCSSLTSVEIPNSVTSIGNEAFWGCSGLTSMEIPNSVTSIGNSAFEYCLGLTSVVIGNGVTSIGDCAFQDCLVLTSVVIGNGATSIGGNAFYGTAWYNNQPDGVVYLDNYLLKYKGTMLSNTSIEIKDGTLLIADDAFEYCRDLTSVVIPNSVTSIGSYAFSDCDNLKSITSLNPTPSATTSYSPFSNYDATLYVPFGAKTAYSNATYWKEFTNIEELAPSHYELTDGEAYDRTSDCFVNSVTYTRTLPNLHWNALYVPFELPYDVIADRYDVAYINDVNGYDTDENGEIDDLAMEIIRIKGGTLKANYPYLIKAKTEADKAMSITVEDATLYAAEENAVDCSSVYQNYVVKGTYTKKTAEELAGKLAISTSGAWQPLAEGTALNPFRLYLSIENRDNSPLKVEPAALSRMRIVERGETTGIEEVVPSQQGEDVIFDLSGRRVKQPVKGGVYIINGKKRIL